MGLHPDEKMVKTTMWGPPVVSWFINPMNTIVISTINHSYWSYKPTERYLGGPTLYKFVKKERKCSEIQTWLVLYLPL